MLDYEKAYKAFERFLDDFDREHEKIKLKIIHTYGVVACAEAIACRMKLSEEDIAVAKLIALLHDIGRFEQIRRFDSFEPGTMDHARYGVKVLFEDADEPMIRRFIAEDTWDEIIRTAIDQHSLYALEEISDPRTLMHARLIRDADKLDNCRVKLEDAIEVLLDASAEEVGAQAITDRVWETCVHRQSIVSADRVTRMDYWVSYVAYFFDINFKETYDIIREQDYVHRIIARIHYTNPDTAKKMQLLEGWLQNL